MTTNRPAYTAVVLVGGQARRLGGADKTRLQVGDRPIVDRVLDAVADAERVVVVGQREPNGVESDRVRFVCEQPPGGGPVAGLAAAMAEVETELLVLLAGDLPFLDDVPETLLAALIGAPDADAVVPVDVQDHPQPLTAAYRSEAVRTWLAKHGDAHGVSMRTLLSGLVVTTIEANALGPDSFFDVDTMNDLTVARERAATLTSSQRVDLEDHMLNDWITALSDELDIDLDLDVHLLLDVAKDAAHAVERPAAPITTFLVGFAAGRAGGSPADVVAASDTARLLAQRWQPQDQS